jgi:streptomycin 6-kinase
MLDREFVLDDAARHRLVDRFGPSGGAWGDELPGLVERCCERWCLTLDQAVSGGTARVFMGEQPGGRRVVLKLTPDPAIAASEAIALRAWAAIPQAADLLDADPGAGALLLAAVTPGTKVSTWPALPSPTEIAALLTALRAVAPPAVGLGSLADRSEFLFDLITPHRERAPAAALVPAGLVERGRRAARALAASGPAALVHGDLHPANVLDGGPARGLVAIDPRPALGDPDFDAQDWVMTQARSAAEIRDRIGQLAALVPGLDGGRVWGWCTAGAALGAIQHLRRHPPDAATRLLLDLAGTVAAPG